MAKFSGQRRNTSAKRARIAADLSQDRRTGTTMALVKYLIEAAMTCPLKESRYAYIASTDAQAKDAAWEHLKQFASVIPGAIWRETELRLDFPNGAQVRLYGAENYERLKGLHLDGCAVHGFGYGDSQIWRKVIGPTLSDRKGWAYFVGTLKGQLTLQASETGIVDAAELADDNAGN